MIYVLEDDNSIRDLVVYTLCHTGMEAKGFEKPSLFWQAIEEETPELLLLDIMLPEEDGLSVLGKLRENPRFMNLPIIMLTAKNSEYDKVLGLDTGADDYVAKPFGIMELVSRVKALLRRAERMGNNSGMSEAVSAEGRNNAGVSNQSGEKILSVANLTIYPERHVVKVDGEKVVLTLKEYELLLMLVENLGMVFNRDQILNKIWGYEFDGESRTVDVHVRTLRQKLGSSGDIVETVRGVGYRIGVEQ